MLRALETGEIATIQPLSALLHPILQKASDSFGDDPAQDTYVGPIASVSSEVLLEIKHGQWRAGVWIDGDACWVITAGLAKGDHKDRDDFYKRLKRLEESKGIASLLPDVRDRALLKSERAQAVVSAWQLQNQKRIIRAMTSVVNGGTCAFSIEAPIPGASAQQIFASVDLTVTISDEPDYICEDVVVEINVADRWKNSSLVWPFTIQLLAAISPPQQGWDGAGGIFSNLLEIGSLSKQLEALQDLTSRREVVATVAGRTAHYAHRRNLAEKSVEGRAARALCGAYFVPTQDVEGLDICPACAAVHKEIVRE